MEQRYPDFQGLLLNDDHTDKGRDAIVLVRGRHIEHLDGVRTPLSEQDYVAVTPLVEEADAAMCGGHRARVLRKREGDSYGF